MNGYAILLALVGLLIALVSIPIERTEGAGKATPVLIVGAALGIAGVAWLIG
jgi:hypothetical protein